MLMTYRTPGIIKISKLMESFVFEFQARPTLCQIVLFSGRPFIMDSKSFATMTSKNLILFILFSLSVLRFENEFTDCPKVEFVAIENHAKPRMSIPNGFFHLVFALGE